MDTTKIAVDGRRSLVAAVRDLSDAAARTMLDDGTLNETAARVSEVTARLGALSPSPWHARSTGKGGADLSNHTNPLLPEVRLRWMDGHVVGEARFSPAYSGPPGLVHGGFLALVFDQVLGVLLYRIGRPSFTANLSVDYLAGTPLDTELMIDSGVTEVSGRRTTAWVTIGAGNTVTARATGLFVTIDRPDTEGH